MNLTDKSLSNTKIEMRIFMMMGAFVAMLTSVYGQAAEPKLKIAQLTGDYFIYTTYHTYEGNLIPANGMYLVTKAGVVLFDTPWDSTQFQPLLDRIQEQHQQDVTVCIATHWHSDRTEGLEYYREKGIATFTTALTDEWSKKNDKKRAQFLIRQDTTFQVGQYSFETYYPGEGHTADNIILWFPSEKILYGGCLIKGTDAENLGFLGDANIQTYEATLRNVQAKCPNPKHTIVSHSDWKDNSSLEHSIRLAEKLTKQNE